MGISSVPSSSLRDDSRGDRRGDEAVGLARAEVIERPDPQHAQATSEEGLQPEEVGGDLGRRVGRDGSERRGLGDGEVVLGDGAVDVGAGDDQDPFDTGGDGGEQNVERSVGVDPERSWSESTRSAPTSAHPARW